MDLKIRDGLAKRLVGEVSATTDVYNVCGDVEIHYADKELDGGSIINGVHASNVDYLGLHFIRRERVLDCYVLAKSIFSPDLKAARLMSFEVPIDFWKVFEGEPIVDVLAAQKLNLIEEALKSVFPKVAEEYKACLKSVKATDYVRYKILHSDIYRQEPYLADELREHTLSYYDEVVATGRCVAGEGEEMSLILEHVAYRKYLEPIPFGIDSIVVWQREGSDKVFARRIVKYEDMRPSIENSGMLIETFTSEEVEMFNYTFDSVANEDFYFDFDKKLVFPVEEQGEGSEYFAIAASYDLGHFDVLSTGERKIVKRTLPWEICEYADAMNALDIYIAELKALPCYQEQGVYIGRTSTYGLRNIVRYRERKYFEE